MNFETPTNPLIVKNQNPLTPAARSIRGHLLLGLAVVAVLAGGVGGWAITADIAGAVVGHGTVAVEGNVKRVQHADGGIVGEIRVRDGERVTAGDLLIRLDDTLTRAGLAVIEKQIDQLTARRLRLGAERDEIPEPAWAALLRDRPADPEFAELVAAEKAIFKIRRHAIEGQRQQLRERILQIEKEIEGLAALRKAKDEELALREQELVGAITLYEKGFISFPQLAELRRLKAQADGERGRLAAEMARAATRIAETELQILQLEQDWRTSILTENQEVAGQLAELAEQRVAAFDRLTRIDLRAPQNGLVHELSVHTIGGVVAAGETIMLIVPDQEELIVEARLQPSDINQVHPGQETVLRFSAFNQRTTPEITGQIRTLAADLTRDPVSGEGWYLARIAISAEQLARLKGLPLVPGMPVEAFIQTGKRSAFSYLLKPLADQIARAMREE